MKTGIELITEERKRQLEEEGWTFEHDDQHTNNEMAFAAAAYALTSNEIEINLDQENGSVRGWLRFLRSTLFPWENEWWKPTPHDRVRELVKAGALIAAEIDRLHRQKQG